MTRIAVLTSGGDAPGMNAAIRAAVRTGVSLGIEMIGVRHGHTGLITVDFVQLGPRHVGGIVDRAGTLLGTSRCPAFLTDAGQSDAIEQLRSQDISGLIVIGGNGSQTGAHALAARGVAVTGVASTIDNDLTGSDITIGATTALGVALEAIDRLRVTAAAHGRVFVIEVMGREYGYLGLMAGIAGGAEAIVIPEADETPEEVAARIGEAHERGKSHAIVVVAEGARNDADALARHFATHGTRLGYELRITKLGHVQRGGVPCAFDRLSGSLLGAAAVERLHGGQHGVLLGLVGGRVTATPYPQVLATRKPLEAHWLHLAQVLAR